MSETKQAQLTDAEMRGMAKELAEQFLAFQRARPQVEEIIGTILRADDAKDYGDWCDWDKLVEKARALESALGGKAE